MSKKFTFTVVLATIFISILLCGCGRGDNSSDDIESNTTPMAIQTIQNLLDDTTVKVKPDYSTIRVTVRSIVTYVEEDLCNLWIVEDEIVPCYKVIFLYKDDKKALIASHSDRDFITSNYQIDNSFKEESYHDEKNYDNGAFAWEFSGCASAIIGKAQKYDVSSIYIYYEDQNTVSLCWNSETDPIG